MRQGAESTKVIEDRTFVTFCPHSVPNLGTNDFFDIQVLIYSNE